MFWWKSYCRALKVYRWWKSKGCTNIWCGSKVFGHHELPDQHQCWHLGIRSTNLWNCSGAINIILLKDIPSFGVLKMVEENIFIVQIGEKFQMETQIMMPSGLVLNIDESRYNHFFKVVLILNSNASPSKYFSGVFLIIQAPGQSNSKVGQWENRNVLPCLNLSATWWHQVTVTDLFVLLLETKASSTSSSEAATLLLRWIFILLSNELLIMFEHPIVL